MKRVCTGGWSPKVPHHSPPRILGYKPGNRGETTHGMCRECAKAVRQDSEEYAKKRNRK